jgi:hypothetical protein
MEGRRNVRIVIRILAWLQVLSLLWILYCVVARDNLVVDFPTPDQYVPLNLKPKTWWAQNIPEFGENKTVLHLRFAAQSMFGIFLTIELDYVQQVWRSVSCEQLVMQKLVGFWEWLRWQRMTLAATRVLTTSDSWQIRARKKIQMVLFIIVN